VFQRVIGSRGLALRVEGAIKRLPKARKEELVVQETILDRLIHLARRTGRAPWWPACLWQPAPRRSTTARPSSGFSICCP